MMATVSVDGCELFYKTIGAGLPVLVMHGGLGFDHTYLHPWLDPLGDMVELVYYDHRGNGRSGRPAKETMTHAQFADDALGLADHLGFEKVAILGHSYGGFIGLEFALRYPERLRYLILLDTAAVYDHVEEIVKTAVERGATAEMLRILGRDLSPDEGIEEQFLKILPLYFKNFDPDIAMRLMENMIFDLSASAAEGEMEAYNMVPRLGEIEMPALVLCGRYDLVCPPSKAEQLHQGLPNSELVIFEDSGHFPYVEQPALFFKTVRAWFSAR